MKALRTDKSLIIIGGPTASGKTEFAIKLAKHFQTEIISADSRQCYKELNIGVARPSDEELNQVKHHFIATESVNKPISAGDFLRKSKLLLEDLFQKHDVVLAVGGSGLYNQALVEGFHSDSPDNAIRSEIQLLYRTKGIVALQDELLKLDSQHYAKIDVDNPQRVMRALERIKSSGMQHSELRKERLQLPDYNVFEYAIDWPREVLYQRINERVDKMMKLGLHKEVEGLRKYQNEYVMNAVGYKELLSHLEGEISLDDAVSKIKQNTRRYAKRQLTWFRNKTSTCWLKPQVHKDYMKIIEAEIADKLQKSI